MVPKRRKLLRRKLLRRVLTVVQNSINSLLQPLLNIAVSYLVIRQTSETLWGEFVSILVMAQLISHIAAWGNREHLLRDFSRQPDRIRQLWQSSLTNRLLIAILLSIAVPLISDSTIHTTLVIIWILAGVIAQSFDVLVLYRRQFLLTIIIEATITALTLTGVLLSGNNLNVTTLIGLFAAAQCIKLITLGLAFRSMFYQPSIHISAQYFRAGLPFFLLGFSGMLASRIDLYTVSAIMQKSDVGRYQVFINLMLYLQALSAFITLPFIKGVYRMTDSSIFKMCRQMFLLGLILVPPALLIASGLFQLLYDLQFTWGFMLMGGAFVLPIYGFIPLIHRLYGQDKTQVVLSVNLVGAAANFLLNLVLLPHIGLYGAILSSAMIQWGMLIVYIGHAAYSTYKSTPIDAQPNEQVTSQL